MPNELTPSRLEQIAAVLERHGVRYLVIGGQAEYLMGSPRVTFDVDICHERTPENLAKLANALTELKVRLRNVPADVKFPIDARSLELGSNFTFVSEFGDFNCLAYVEPVGGYSQLAADAETHDIGEMTLRTISLQNLLKVKKHIGRAKDRESLLQLLAIEKIRAEQR